jgi:uncharacterized protein YdaU (DUF1376 family)
MSKREQLPYMPLFGGDYLKETRHLTLEQHGAYLHLMIEYWTKGCLPDDDVQLARIVGISLPKWLRMRPTIKAFFSDDGWHHEVLDEQFAKSWARSERGRKGAAAKWGKVDA